MGYETTFCESPCQHYELACSVDDDGINMQYRLHIGDATNEAVLAFWTNGLVDHWTIGLLDLIHSNSKY